jgi:Domain of unknown function (DUF5076)
MSTFDPLQVPPAALEQGGVEILRAAIVEGGLHVSLQRVRSMFDAEMDAPTDPGSTAAIS